MENKKLEPMTPEEFADAMRELVKKYGGDKEIFHIEADYLISALLTALRYEEGIEIFDDQPKWYS